MSRTALRCISVVTLVLEGVEGNAIRHTRPPLSSTFSRYIMRLAPAQYKYWDACLWVRNTWFCRMCLSVRKWCVYWNSCICILYILTSSYFLSFFPDSPCVYFSSAGINLSPLADYNQRNTLPSLPFRRVARLCFGIPSVGLKYYRFSYLRQNTSLRSYGRCGNYSYTSTLPPTLTRQLPCT